LAASVILPLLLLYEITLELTDPLNMKTLPVVAMLPLVGMKDNQSLSLKPEIPEDPDDPLEPEVPLKPDVPEEPEEPFVPELPELPEVPLLPDEPSAPELPLLPEEPEEPFAPEAKTSQLDISKSGEGDPIGTIATLFFTV
jgi:hypothetical protein